MSTTDEYSRMLAETVARHFPEARVEGVDVDLGFAGLRAHCKVESIQPAGGGVSASLFAWFTGGPFGEHPAFASASGYGATIPEAVIGGGCQWTCTFGPVFRAALAGEPPSESMLVRDVVVRGQKMRLFVDGLDRALSRRDDGGMDALKEARPRLSGGRFLVERVIEAGTLPLLHGRRPTLVSVFCGDHPERPLLEIKVDGCDWKGGPDPFVGRRSSDADSMLMLRDVAILVPIDEPAPLDRASIEQTLQGLRANTALRSVGWRGFRRHGGELHPPLSLSAIERLEASLGALPTDYRAFLRDVSAGGAGPGYGLLRPDHATQRWLAQGEFGWESEAPPACLPAGVLVLSHAGCGMVYLLVLRGPRRGEVWVDSNANDDRVRMVAPSFDHWYRDWLAAAARDASPWVHWDRSRCATPAVLSNALNAMTQRHGPEHAREELARSKGLELRSGHTPYFGPGDPLDPCAGCVELAARFSLPETLFANGTDPHQGRPTS